LRGSNPLRLGRFGFKVNGGWRNHNLLWSERLWIERKLVVFDAARDKAGGCLRQIHVLKMEPRDVVSQFQERVAVLQSGDFRVHHQRLDLAVQAEILSCTSAIEVCLLHALDLDFTDGVRDPFGGLRFGRLEEDFGGWL
jgi:hypothetical protein